MKGTREWNRKFLSREGSKHVGQDNDSGEDYASFLGQLGHTGWVFSHLLPLISPILRRYLDFFFSVTTAE